MCNNFHIFQHSVGFNLEVICVNLTELWNWRCCDLRQKCPNLSFHGSLTGNYEIFMKRPAEFGCELDDFIAENLRTIPIGTCWNVDHMTVIWTFDFALWRILYAWPSCGQYFNVCPSGIISFGVNIELLIKGFALVICLLKN